MSNAPWRFGIPYGMFVLLLSSLPIPDHYVWGQMAWTIPYQGSSDSPFRQFGIESTFRLEDFEQGVWTLDGVELAENSVYLGRNEILRVGSVGTGNSIREDTGNPGSGHLIVNSPSFCAITFPPRCPSLMSWRWSEDSLGRYPTFVGFVWTDAVRFNDPGFFRGLPTADVSAYGPEGVITQTLHLSELPLRNTNDVTSDDRFIGFYNPQGISRLDILAITDLDGGLLSVDHVQFGMAALAGDLDRNGVVEFVDFLNFAARFGEPGQWKDGDFDWDGETTFRDFLLLAANYGETLPLPDGTRAASLAAPEPTGFFDVGYAGIVLLGYLRRRR